MAAKAASKKVPDSDEQIVRVYEAGYHIAPTVKEGDIEQVVSGIRSIVEKEGGSFVAEGAPALMRLAYPMTVIEAGKKTEHDRGYFGWLKFEATTGVAHMLEASLRANASILRSIVFTTVREDTRAKMKAPTLREVKRTDTIKSSPRRAEEVAAPVSEADLEKAIQDITTE